MSTPRDKGKISISSALARALVGSTEGPIVKVKAPGGVRTYMVERLEWR
jgi:transcription elongation factor GreA